MHANNYRTGGFISRRKDHYKEVRAEIASQEAGKHVNAHCAGMAPEAERWASAQSFIGTLTIVFRVRVGAPRFSRIVERAAAEAELGIEANARHAASCLRI
jgi:hypothetical protein